jgi:hypothetical protein
MFSVIVVDMYLRIPLKVQAYVRGVPGVFCNVPMFQNLVLRAPFLKFVFCKRNSVASLRNSVVKFEFLAFIC